MIWWCACPQVVEDDDGQAHTCQVDARIVRTHDEQSTSGPVLLARIHCDAGHVNDQLFEDVTLYG